MIRHIFGNNGTAADKGVDPDLILLKKKSSDSHCSRLPNLAKTSDMVQATYKQSHSTCNDDRLMHFD